MNLTLRAYAVAALVAVLGIVGQWAGGFFNQAWYMVAVGLVLAWCVEGVLVRARRPLVERRAPTQGRLGERLHGQWHVINPASRPLWLETQPLYAEGLSGDNTKVQRWVIPAEGTGDASFSVVPQRLGLIPWQPLYGRIRGVFGLAWWPRNFDLPGQLHVVPARLRDGRQRLSVQHRGELDRPLPGHGNELVGLREYAHGDPVRHIDWKATARSGRTMVRLYSQEQRLELMLLIDAGRRSGVQSGALTRLHHYTNVAARLAELALSSHDRVGVMAFAAQPGAMAAPDKGARALQRIRNVLTEIKSTREESNPLAAALRVRQVLGQRSLVVILTDIEEHESASQLAQVVRLLSTKHLPLIAAPLDEEIAALTRQPAQHWLDPYTELAAAETLHGIRQTALQLQRLGAHVVQAPADRLDSAVLRYYQDLRDKHRI